jgi:hypothetical protein
VSVLKLVVALLGGVLGSRTALMAASTVWTPPSKAIL